MRISRHLKTTLLTICLAGAASAAQIAQFIETNQTNDFSSTNNGGTSVSFGTTTTSLVNFTFAPGLGTPFDNITRAATLTFTSSSSTPATNVAGNLDEVGFTGSFSIIDNLTSTLLLGGTFGPSGHLNGGVGGPSATFQDSTPPVGEVSFSSAYLSFAGSIDQGFSLSLSNGIPQVAFGAGNFPVDANYVGSGTFSANPLPITRTPEPATLTLMGGALIGLGLLTRKKRNA